VIGVVQADTDKFPASGDARAEAGFTAYQRQAVRIELA